MVCFGHVWDYELDIVVWSTTRVLHICSNFASLHFFQRQLGKSRDQVENTTMVDVLVASHKRPLNPVM